MGSIVWARCYWYWSWIERPYIIDGLNACLCEICKARCRDGGRPPWQPDGIARTVRWLGLFFDPNRERPASQPLPEEVHELIALCLIYRDIP